MEGLLDFCLSEVVDLTQQSLKSGHAIAKAEVSNSFPHYLFGLEGLEPSLNVRFRSFWMLTHLNS